MTTDIFITAPIRHFEWLVCCLRGIEKNATGFRDCVLVCDPSSKIAWLELARRFPFLRLAFVEEGGVGHLFQMWAKTTAYQWTDADHILYVDSDSLFKRPVTPADFMRDGKPLVIKSAYSCLQHAHVTPDGSTHPVPWQQCTEAAIGPPVISEYMRVSGQLYPRWLPLKATEYLEKKHGKTASEYILASGITETCQHWGYSEFNYLGAYAERFHASDFAFHDIEADGEGIYKTWPVLQMWSYGDPSQSPWKEKIESVLGI